MLKTILISLAVIVIVLAVIVALQPSEFRVARSTTISASPATVFAQVNDFHKWEAWNPWGKIDPAMKQAYAGAPAGSGAMTWSMTGQNNFMAKAVHLFMNMDKMIGGQFEKGLAEMKAVAEASPKQ